jgi:hypothetical protein
LRTTDRGGSTCSRLDTQNLLERGISAAYRNAAEAQMTLHFRKTTELLVERAHEISFDAYTIRNPHAALSKTSVDTQIRPPVDT